MRIIDHARRDALSRLLLESVTTSAPGDKLDEKLAQLTFTDMNDDRELLLVYNVNGTHVAPLVPAPSSDDAAWWDDPGKHHAQPKIAEYS